MRNIRTQEEIDKSKKIRGRILAGFMLLLLLGSVAGFAFLSSPGNGGNVNPQLNTGSGRAYNVGHSWALNFNGQEIYFRYSDEEVKEIDVQVFLGLGDYYGKTLYIDSENREVYNEIVGTLGQLALRVQEACYGECNRDLPIKDCNENLIIYRNGENKAYQNQSCVIIDGDLMAVDAFLYKMFLK